MWPKYKNITIDRKRNTKSTGVVTTLTPQNREEEDSQDLWLQGLRDVDQGEVG